MAFYTRRAAEQTQKMAGGTVDLARETKELAAQTKIAAEAGVREAQATANLAEEQRRDRDFAWQPILTFEDLQGGTRGEHWWHDVRLSNIGNGLAINCLLVVYQTDAEWAFQRGIWLKAGESKTVNLASTAADRASGIPLGFFDQGPGVLRIAPLPEHERVLISAVCSDVLGRRWHFLQDFAPESVRPGESQAPAWATWLP